MPKKEILFAYGTIFSGILIGMVIEREGGLEEEECFSERMREREKELRSTQLLDCTTFNTKIYASFFINWLKFLPACTI